MTTPRENVYKILFSCALGIIVTGAGIWLMLGAHSVSRIEMEAYVAGVTKLSTTVDTLSLRVQDLTTQIAVLNVRLETQGTLPSSPRSGP